MKRITQKLKMVERKVGWSVLSAFAVNTKRVVSTKVKIKSIQKWCILNCYGSMGALP